MDFLKKLTPKSRKLGVFVISAIVFLVNALVGRPIDEDTIEKLLALSASYLLGQGIADHGWSGAITGARRAAVEGKEAVDAVMSVIAASKDGAAPVSTKETDGE